MTTQTQTRDPVVHVRFAGRSIDVPLEGLGLGGTATDAQIRRSLAVYLEVPASRLEDHVIDRHPNGNVTLRPEAVFG